MNKIIIIASVVIVIMAAAWWFLKGGGEEQAEQSQMANPASVMCGTLGGELQTLMFPSGEMGFCNFSDGSVCEEWELYRGDCKMGDLKVEILKAGEGPRVENGDNVAVHYTGTFEDGTKFDSSLDRGTPYTFGLGTGYVIEGWEQGILGMQVGEKRKLTVSSDLGYGDEGYPGFIPGGATLIFEVELLKIN